jgi:predicted nucleotidyltransferase
MINRPSLPIELPHDALVDYCRPWKITKLEGFGSVLRDDFGPDSDEVDWLRVWDTVVIDLPKLKIAMQSLVPREP